MARDAQNYVHPDEVTHRPFHYRDLAQAGAEFARLGDCAVAWRYGTDTRDEIAQAQSLGIADLSPLPRTGFKGRDTAEWLREQKVKISDASNVAVPCGRGSLAARLAPGEVLVLGSRTGKDTLWQRLEDKWSFDAGLVFPVPRRDASFWFNITGTHATAMFQKICGVDLRAKSFVNHAIAQTSVARSNCIIIRDDIGATSAFHVLGDSASASYMWACLIDAMVEFGGRPIGLAALQKLK